MSQYQVLEDVGKKRGIKLFAAQKTTHKQRNLVYDFLRHGSNNPESGVDFVPHANGGYLYDAIFAFRRLFGVGSAYMKAFNSCFEMLFAGDNPEFRDTVAEELPKGFTVSDCRRMSRKVLFTKLVKAFRQDGIAGSHVESP